MMATAAPVYLGALGAPATHLYAPGYRVVLTARLMAEIHHWLALAARVLLVTRMAECGQMISGQIANTRRSIAKWATGEVMEHARRLAGPAIRGGTALSQHGTPTVALHVQQPTVVIHATHKLAMCGGGGPPPPGTLRVQPMAKIHSIGMGTQTGATTQVQMWTSVERANGSQKVVRAPATVGREGRGRQTSG